MPGRRSSSVVAALAGPFVLGACATSPPTGPTVWVLPAQGKDLAHFQQEDGACRQQAQRAIGYDAPQQQAANQTAVGGAIAGTAAGTGGAQVSTADLQRLYDIAYMQCMVASGNQVPPAGAYAFPYGPYPWPGYYGYPAWYSPGFVGGAVTLGVVGGDRHVHHHRHHVAPPPPRLGVPAPPALASPMRPRPPPGLAPRAR
jgi:hypothetical protein